MYIHVRRFQVKTFQMMITDLSMSQQVIYSLTKRHYALFVALAENQSNTINTYYDRAIYAAVSKN